MRDKVFLIWSGNNTIALKIKQILEDEYNYICCVGGNVNNDSVMFTMGDTVVRQMKTCNQAIVIFQNKNDTGISNNLFFELGYVSSRYGMKKVHCVKRKDDMIVLPSDFDNSFVKSIEAADDDTYAREVVSYFLSRQKLSVDTNKMYLINNRYLIHEMIQLHYSEIGSKCSDYELAQYILFYMQAGVMFQDDEKILDELRDFKRRNGSEFSDELTKSVNLSIALLEVQTRLISENGIVYLSEDAFRNYYNHCKDIIDGIKDDEMGTFDEWAKVIASENLAYACSLSACNPNLPEQTKNYLFNKVIEYGNRCVAFISNLEQVTPCKENNDGVGLISVFKAYIYRHIFVACKNVHSDEAEKWLKLSLKERKSLLINFDRNSIDTMIYSNFEMEYYLNLMEYIEYMGKDRIDEFDYIMYLSDIDAFISKYDSQNHVHAYIKKISEQRKQLSR